MSENNHNQLTEIQKDAIGEIGNISMSSAATTLHDILSRKVIITTPRVSVTSANELSQQYKVPYIIVDVTYTEGIMGSNILMIKTDDAKLITAIMLGEEPDLNVELGELHLSAMGEVMNQMIGASSTSLSTLIANPVNISPPNVSVVSISEDRLKLSLKDDKMISTKFNMNIEGLLDTEIVLLMPMDYAIQLVNSFLEVNNSMMDNQGETQGNANEHQDSPVAQDSLIRQSDEKHSNVKNVTLQSFDKEENVKAEADNIELLMDVPLQLTVELGRTKRYLKDILELNLGSIVSLEKPAGDLIDVLVNGKLIAKGEVVVIDDNFGIRITDIVSPNKRYNYPK